MTYREPCCTCPPECDDDESGDTCIDASCAVCLHGCPAGEARCCKYDALPALTENTDQQEI